MTQTVERPESRDAPAFAEPVPRRTLMSRLSLGHLVMVIAGLLAFLLVLVVLNDRAETSRIALAGRDIEAGTAISFADFDFVEVSGLSGQILGSFLSQDQLEVGVAQGWIAARTLTAGTAVGSDDFRTAASDNELRAMSIPINAGNAVGGVLSQGDRVDIIVVRSAIASYVATNVEVIRVQTSGSSIGSGGAVTVTVAVDADTSLRLASAINDGSIEIVRATGAALADDASTYDPRAVPVPDTTDGASEGAGEGG